MAAGNHLDQGRTPAPVSAYLRDLVGWCGNQVDLNTGGRFEARHGDYDTALRYSTDAATNEYFLVENRSALGFDAHSRPAAWRSTTATPGARTSSSRAPASGTTSARCSRPTGTSTSSRR